LADQEQGAEYKHETVGKKKMSNKQCDGTPQGTRWPRENQTKTSRRKEITTIIVEINRL
jgi:hypothetical protein